MLSLNNRPFERTDKLERRKADRIIQEEIAGIVESDLKIFEHKFIADNTAIWIGGDDHCAGHLHFFCLNCICCDTLQESQQRIVYTISESE